jgi:hypothetical protein
MGRYSVVVGLLFAAVIAIALINTLGNKDEGTLGLDKLPARWPLPEFAVPRAAGSLEGDANVAQDDCETSQTPCPANDRRAPACRISTAGAIRSSVVRWCSRSGSRAAAIPASSSRTWLTASTSATVAG